MVGPVVFEPTPLWRHHPQLPSFFNNTFIIELWKLLECLVMTCYFRHLREIFEAAGIEVTKENKRNIDRVIHNLVGIEYKNCSATWKAVKARLGENRKGFITELIKAWGKA